MRTGIAMFDRDIGVFGRDLRPGSENTPGYLVTMPGGVPNRNNGQSFLCRQSAVRKGVKFNFTCVPPTVARFPNTSAIDG